MVRVFLMVGSISGALSVLTGAFGAHALKDSLDADMLRTFETAVRYHQIHALAIIVTAWASERWKVPSTIAAGWLFLYGTVLFSGSLYALSVTGFEFMGVFTPLGGGTLMAGWMALAWAAWQGK